MRMSELGSADRHDSPPSPRVVFIHGVGDAKKPEKWLTPLNKSLQGVGIDVIDVAEVPDVRYRKALRKRKDEKSERPERSDSTAEGKKAYQANQRQLSGLLAKQRRRQSPYSRLPRPLRRHASWMARKGLKDAERYRVRRERVCNLVLDQMGPGEFIVIGHSLGSVVAADLLTRLRPDQHIRLLLTVGSPLGAGDWSSTWNSLRPFPFHAVDAWVNVYNPYDYVTVGVGLRRRTRRVVDVPVRRFKTGDRKWSPSWMQQQHKIGPYITQPAVRTAIRWAVQGRMPPNDDYHVSG